MTRQIPMLFSPEMMRAHQAGRKIETRRVLTIRGYRGFYDFGRSDTKGYDWHFRRCDGVWCDFRHDKLLRLLPAQPGDLIWAKETHWATGHWVMTGETTPTGKNKARFDREPGSFILFGNPKREGWIRRPSIFLPKADSRLTLRVKEVGVERLQDISYSDCIAEGVESTEIWARRRAACLEQNQECGSVCRDSYAELWNRINGAGAWEQNPWVTVTRYEPIWQNVLEVAV